MQQSYNFTKNIPIPIPNFIRKEYPLSPNPTKTKTPLIKLIQDRELVQLDSSIICVQPSSNQNKFFQILDQEKVNIIKKIDEYPRQSVGLIISQVKQNGNIKYIYGTGTLIFDNIVITSAENVYCPKMKKQYQNIKFIPGINESKYSGSYDVIRLYYPETQDKKSKFAILQLYDDLKIKYGYVGLNAECDLKDQNIQMLGYRKDLNQSKLQFFIKKFKGSTIQRFIDYQSVDAFKTVLLGSPFMIFNENNDYSIIGIHNGQYQSRYNTYITHEMKNIIKECTKITKLNLWYKKLGKNLCELNLYELVQLQQVNLYNNFVGIEGCEYLKNANWINLRSINLGCNLINPQCCKSLASTNWLCLNVINLLSNNIGPQGCKYLKSANWSHLISIDLGYNMIGNQGCKQLSQANWPFLMELFLSDNKIDVEGIKYLRQANWIYLRQLVLCNNQIGSEGCKQLIYTNWIHLNKIDLDNNGIDNEGCRYLRQTNWISLNQICLSNYIRNMNCIGSEGTKYLKDSIWVDVKMFDLRYSNIGLESADLLMFKEVWPSCEIILAQ